VETPLLRPRGLAYIGSAHHQSAGRQAQSIPKGERTMNKQKDAKHHPTKKSEGAAQKKDQKRDRSELKDSDLDKISGGRMPLRPKDLG
jgi:hypothetical protein